MPNPPLAELLDAAQVQSMLEALFGAAGIPSGLVDVHSGAIIEALEKLYDGQPLVRELLNR